MYYVYVLKSLKDSNLYTGYTSDIDARILEHHQGLVKSTKNRQPLKLIYYECFLSETDARSEEKYLKSGGKAKTELKLKLKKSLIL